MALTLLQLQDQVERVWGSEYDPRLDMNGVINNAGQYLFSMHSWSWRRRPPVDLAFTSGQNYCDLPEDFGSNGEVLGVTLTANGVVTAEPASLEQVEILRNSYNNFSGLTYYYAVSFPSQTGSTVAPAKARLELSQTPGSSDTTALRLIYRAGWITLNEATDAANIPLHMENLLLRIVRAYAAQRYVAEGISFGLETLDDVEQSAELSRLKRSDGSAQANLGRITGGILSVRRPRIDPNWNFTTE